MTNKVPTTLSFDAFFDEDAQVWVASGQDRISTEAPSRDKLLEKLKVIMQDVLEERTGQPVHDVKIVVNWQEMRTFDTTELMVA
jgi:Domain of unknown function (DUF1902)